MTSSSEFTAVSRRGVRASSTHLVVHARRAPSPPSRVGFVVSKAVGNAVTRNRVKRRLRHLVVPLLATSPDVLVVVRAKPGIAAATSQELSHEVAGAWRRTMSRLATPEAARPNVPTPTGEAS